MDRRKFLRNLSGAASACVIGESALLSTVSAQECDSFKIDGAGLFGVDYQLRDDPRGILMAVSEIGYRQVQGYGLNGSSDIRSQLLGLQLGEFKQALRDAQLTMPICGTTRTSTINDVPAIAEVATELGADTILVGASRGPFFNSDRGSQMALSSLRPLDRFADELNDLGDAFSNYGLTLAYHAYNFDFTVVEDEIPFDYLMSRTDPDLVKIKLDSAWLAVAGMDPPTYFEKYSGRVVACCVKDFDPRIPVAGETTFQYIAAGAIVEPGSGMLDFERIVRVINSTGVKYPFVDIERSEDALERMERGLRHLQSLRSC